MFKSNLIDFLIESDKASKLNILNEWYLSDFNEQYLRAIEYEEGFSMLIDTCNVWLTHPNFTYELINIINSIRNKIATNTFPEYFEKNKNKIMEIYMNTDIRIKNSVTYLYKDSDIDKSTIDLIIKAGINEEEKMFHNVFKNSNIDWY